MTDQELRKLSRKDLLELLVAQGRERDALQAELEKAIAALADKQLRIEQSGSIAEAALQVNGVFNAAQEAAEQYLENIRLRSEQIDAVCAQREKESKEKADRQLQEAARAAHQIEEDTKRRCQEMENAAKEKAETYWAEVSTRLQTFYQEHKELKKLLLDGGEV